LENPDVGWIKVNAYGSTIGNSPMVASGVIFRDLRVILVDYVLNIKKLYIHIYLVYFLGQIYHYYLSSCLPPFPFLTYLQLDNSNQNMHPSF
jgi:hypothetical protein